MTVKSTIKVRFFSPNIKGIKYREISYPIMPLHLNVELQEEFDSTNFHRLSLTASPMTVRKIIHCRLQKFHDEYNNEFVAYFDVDIKNPIQFLLSR